MQLLAKDLSDAYVKLRLYQRLLTILQVTEIFISRDENDPRSSQRPF